MSASAYPGERADTIAWGGAWSAVLLVAVPLVLWAAGYAGLRYAFEGLIAFAGYDWPDSRKEHETRLALDLVELDDALAERGAASKDRSDEDLAHLRARRDHSAAELEQVRGSEPLPLDVAVLAKGVIIGLPPAVMLIGAAWALVDAWRRWREQQARRRQEQDPEEQKKRMDLLLQRYEALNPGRIPPGVAKHAEAVRRMKLAGQEPDAKPLLELSTSPRKLHDGCVRVVSEALAAPVAAREQRHVALTQPPPLPKRPKTIGSDARRGLPEVRDENGFVWTRLCDGTDTPVQPRLAQPPHLPTRPQGEPFEPHSRVTIAGPWRQRPKSPEPRHWSDPPDDPAEWPMTQTAWSNWIDARDLLRHAVKRIPPQHLSVILAELAERAWPAWHARRPDDWRPALCIATLRAWCFGEATVAEVLLARDAMAELALENLKDRSERFELGAARAACDAAAFATAYVEATDPDECSYDAALTVLDEFVQATPSAFAEAVSVALRASDAAESPVGKSWAAFQWDDERERAERRHAATAYVRAAKLIRGLVPYHQEVSTRWIVAGGTVRLDDAELILDGWKIARMTTSTRRGRSDAQDRS